MINISLSWNCCVVTLERWNSGRLRALRILLVSLFSSLLPNFKLAKKRPAHLMLFTTPDLSNERKQQLNSGPRAIPKHDVRKEILSRSLLFFFDTSMVLFIARIICRMLVAVINCDCTSNCGQYDWLGRCDWQICIVEINIFQFVRLLCDSWVDLKFKIDDKSKRQLHMKFPFFKLDWIISWLSRWKIYAFQIRNYKMKNNFKTTQIDVRAKKALRAWSEVLVKFSLCMTRRCL